MFGSDGIIIVGLHHLYGGNFPKHFVIEDNMLHCFALSQNHEIYLMYAYKNVAEKIKRSIWFFESKVHEIELETGKLVSGNNIVYPEQS